MRIWPLLACALLLLPLRAQALSSASFQVHVRPQLVGIYQDFRQILATFTDYPNEILQLMNQMDDLRSAAQTLRQACPLRTELGCLSNLVKIQQELRDLDRLFIKYQGNVRFSEATGLAPIAGQRIWLRLDQTRDKLQRQVTVEILGLSAGRSGNRLSSVELLRMTDEIEAYGDLLVVEFIPPKFQVDFRSAWMNFFRPLHRYAEREGRAVFLTSNLDQLNFYWNLLNMRMTKRLKKTPEGMGGPLNAIQNRWNQVMRINYGQ